MTFAVDWTADQGSGVSEAFFVRVGAPACQERSALDVPLPIEDFQVLTPMYGRSCGVHELNQSIREALNPLRDPSSPRGRQAQLIENGKTWRVGDKVQQIKNNYDYEVFNGEGGRYAPSWLTGTNLPPSYLEATRCARDLSRRRRAAGLCP